jgi:hypothetical protein
LAVWDVDLGFRRSDGLLVSHGLRFLGRLGLVLARKIIILCCFLHPIVIIFNLYDHKTPLGDNMTALVIDIYFKGHGDYTAEKKRRRPMTDAEYSALMDEVKAEAVEAGTWE